MPIDVSKLMVECQMALKMTQKQMGAVVGKDRRTILRWQDKGTILGQEDAEALADAVRPVRPDLADRVLAARREAVKRFQLSPSRATARQAKEILDAAVAASGASAKATRAAIVAAFAKAEELKVELRGVVKGWAAGE